MKKLKWKRICRAAADRRGASILLALFLMLVVAAVGAVILTASVAAGGRRSEIAKMDQRYYSVGSAAEVMRTLIEEQSVTVVREKVTKKKTEYTITVDEETGTAKRGPGNVVSNKTEYDVYLEDSSNSLDADADNSILIRAAVDLMQGYNEPQSLYGAELPILDGEKSHTYTLSHSVPSGIDASALEVQVIMTVEPGGNLSVTLTSGDSTTDDVYSLTEHFALSLSHRESSANESGTPDIDGSGLSYTETITKTTTATKTDTFSWVFDSMDIDR